MGHSAKHHGACGDFADVRRLTRRAALQAGSLGLLTAPLLAYGNDLPSPTSSSPGFGSARRCLFIFMWGGPSQLDTWDMKPDAPDEIRGEFKPIATSVPGTFISEHFPLLAPWAHRYAIIRSMTHEDVAHLSSAHHILTGAHASIRFTDKDPPSRKDTPHLGSIMARLRPGSTSLPSFVMAPWIVSHPAAPGGRAHGQHAGWLGQAMDPFLVGDPNLDDFSVPGCKAAEDVPATRLRTRTELLHSLDRGAIPTGDWDDMARQATDLIVSPEAADAFDVKAEPTAVRERYGRHTHGQCLLLARRLLERGVPVVTVNWHDDRSNFWDTHGQNFKKLKKTLMPQADQGFSALLSDLDARGMLDDTIVVWVGEFGRKPQINRASAGREHWARCYSAVLAGGGIRGGAIYGASDKIAAYPSVNPVSPSDLVATVYHSLGISTDMVLHDRQSVPKHIVLGKPILPLFS